MKPQTFVSGARSLATQTALAGIVLLDPRPAADGHRDEGDRDILGLFELEVHLDSGGDGRDPLLDVVHPVGVVVCGYLHDDARTAVAVDRSDDGYVDLVHAQLVELVSGAWGRDEATHLPSNH